MCIYETVIRLQKDDHIGDLIELRLFLSSPTVKCLIIFLFIPDSCWCVEEMSQCVIFIACYKSIARAG